MLPARDRRQRSHRAREREVISERNGTRKRRGGGIRLERCHHAHERRGVAIDACTECERVHHREHDAADADAEREGGDDDERLDRMVADAADREADVGAKLVPDSQPACVAGGIFVPLHRAELHPRRALCGLA